MVNEDVQSRTSDVPPQVVKQRTEEYVQHQTQLHIQDSASPLHMGILHHEKNPTLQISPVDIKESHTPIFKPSIYERAQAIDCTFTPEQATSPYRRIPRQQDQHHFPAANPPPMEEFAKFLARRELVTTGLSKFDDTPESFRAWESSFLSATQGSGLTYSEELDLLIKWLGKESSEHVKRIRSVHVTNPQAALYLSWERLQKCYATPEIVESVLFKRLDSFPRLSVKDNVKLRELSDLLMELQAAKNEGHFPGLSYLDTPRGIKPIVEKLPPGLQEKWLLIGSRYKEEHRVTFLPFSFFVEFAHGQAKARNDPSFVLSTNSQSYSKSERTPPRHSGFKAAVSVHKTDVSAPVDTDRISKAESERRESDPARFCSVHNKTHPLVKCRAFRMKPLQERKNILKEHKRCVKCCSPNHLAKDCQATLKCSECESDRPCSALHPNTSQSQSSPSLATSDAEAESQDSTPLEVTSRCTKVCGKGRLPRSCAKV